MRTLARQFCLQVVILLALSVAYSGAQSSKTPITDRELMSMVAGGAVSEDIAA